MTIHKHVPGRIGRRIAVAASTLIAAAVAAGGFASAGEAATPPCQLFADVPVWDGGYLVGVGGRLYCSTPRTVTVKLNVDRPWWPDRTLAKVSKTGTTVILEARHYCTGWDDVKVYTETTTNTGGKMQSGRLLTSC